MDSLFVQVSFLKDTHVALVLLSLLWFSITLPTFVISASREPGYLEKTFDYILLVRQFLDKEIDMDILCTYCEIIKSETSFHCVMCGRCVEMFDHHCPFINNCLGYLNYKYFLVFIVTYFCFLCCVIGELVRRQLELALQPDFQFKMSGMTWTVGLMAVLPLPIIFYQVSSQCRGLCRVKKQNII